MSIAVLEEEALEAPEFPEESETPEVQVVCYHVCEEIAGTLRLLVRRGRHYLRDGKEVPQEIVDELYDLRSIFNEAMRDAYVAVYGDNEDADDATSEDEKYAKLHKAIDIVTGREAAVLRQRKIEIKPRRRGKKRGSLLGDDGRAIPSQFGSRVR